MNPSTHRSPKQKIDNIQSSSISSTGSPHLSGTISQLSKAALSHPQRHSITEKKSSFMKSTELYQNITNTIIDLLKQGVAPWRKTWGGNMGFARNYESQREYRGINMLMLNFIFPAPIPMYLTWHQVKKMGGKVKKGVKAQKVYHFNVLYRDSNNKSLSEEKAQQMLNNGTEVKRIPYLKYFNVFNIDDIEGIEFDIPEMPQNDNPPIERCEQLLADMPEQANLVIGKSNKACYKPLNDLIEVPDRTVFENSDEYYNTLFHELTHWTGHLSRLNRDGITSTKPTKEIYALEELTAEIGATFLCAKTGINRQPLVENNAAYIQGWLEHLQNDERFIFRAVSQAQKAVDFITETVMA